MSTYTAPATSAVSVASASVGSNFTDESASRSPESPLAVIDYGRDYEMEENENVVGLEICAVARGWSWLRLTCA